MHHIRVICGFARPTISRHILDRTQTYFKYSRRSVHHSMRFVQFLSGDRRGVGVELSDGGDIVDLNAGNPELPNNMVEFIASGQPALLAAKKVVDSGRNIVARDTLRLLAPVTAPDKVVCIGMNYVDHCLEQNAPIPKEPVIFNKFPSTITASGEDLIYPDVTEELDWEVELVIVVGRTGKNIPESEAMNYVFGYTVAHDVSARDWQMKRNGKQWFVGKTMDTFCPLAPAIVTKEGLHDPHKLGIRCRVNGVTKQDSNTDQLVFKTEAILAFTSKLFTLRPGDIILTGTPPGVGVFRNPPEFLKRGDVVECEIDGIGRVVNTVV